jgi:GNAT superfamily N-acetyltransferase
VWVGELDGAVIGWVEMDGDRLRGMYVRPDLSGRGLGSALLAHAEKRIASDGHRAVYLSASWNAEPFYFRYGYQALAARPMVKHLI